MYKKLVLLALSFLLQASPALAQMSYLEEMQALGTVSGQGLACGSSQYDKYEMLARAIMLTKAPTSKALQDGVYAYNAAKADSYLAKQRDGGYLCGEITGLFNSQEIFQITLYEDGTLKMPDGKIVTPKIPYDAKQIYKKDEKLKNGLKEVYAGSVQKAQAKIRKAEVNAPVANINQDRPLVVESEPVRQPAVRNAPAFEKPQDSTIGHISRGSNRY